MRKTLALTLSIFASATVAQAQTTDCTRNPTGFSCSTSPSPDQQFNQGLQQLAAGLAAMRARRAEAANQKVAIEQRRQDQMMEAARQSGERSVIDAIQAHDCVRARDLALTVGGLDLAAKAIQLCPVPTGPAPQ